MDSISDRLKSLGFKPTTSVQKPASQSREKLETVISGREISNSAGSFVIKEQLYPRDYQHGRIKFPAEISTANINRSARIESRPDALNRMLFIDTETSGLSGGAGTFAFLIGIGWFQADGFRLQQLIIRDPSEEPAMLLFLSNIIDLDTIFVSFNGKSFDIPLVQNRFILNRMPCRLRELDHIDILQISRKLWRKHLPSCTLKDLEVAILEFSRSSEDVPGWMIPDIYFEYLRTGNPGGLSDVIYHNAQDVVSLAALFIHITNILETEQPEQEISTNDLIAISRIYWELGSHEVAWDILQHCKSRKLNQEQTRSVFSMLGKFYKNNHDYSEAAKNWEIAAHNGDPYACIELAKYKEHIIRDIENALEWCEQCKQTMDQTFNPPISMGFQKELEKRITRLQMKGMNHVQKTHKG